MCHCAAIGRLTAAFCCVFACLPAFAVYNREGVPDSAGIRAEIEEAWLDPPLEVVRAKQPEIRRNELNERFQVRFEDRGERFVIVVAPERLRRVEVFSSANSVAQTEPFYPEDGRGSWVLTKNSADNRLVSIKYYFMEDPSVYVQFRPAEGKTLADFIVYGAFAARGVQVGVPSERFYTASFAQARSWTDRSLPWQYADINPALYGGIIHTAETIRANLPRIVYAEGAVQGGDGSVVSLPALDPFDTDSALASAGISDTGDKLVLSSAGFVKWIVDSHTLSAFGSAIQLEPLLRATTVSSPLSYEGIMSQQYNLTFALDWTRNLAAAAESISARRSRRYEELGVDVRITPFASALSPAGVAVTPSYVKDVGYLVEILKSLLYVLAAEEPGKFYLGALRQSDTSVSPEIHFFNKCAAFFPYFDESGMFKVDVFMDGVETTVESFMRTYPDTFVHLVRIASSEAFAAY